MSEDNTQQADGVEQDTDEPQKSNIQYIGDGIKYALYLVKIVVIGAVPMLTLLGIWLVGFIVVLNLNIGIFDYVPLFETEHEGHFNIAFWFITGAIVPGLITAFLYYRTTDKKLRTCDAPNGGNGGGYELSNHDWDDLEVHLYDEDADRYMGEKTTKNALTYNGEFHEAVAYYPDDNIAVASGVGEKSMYEMRMHEDRLLRLMTSMRDKFQSGIETDSRRQEYATEDAAREVNRVTRDFERESLPTGELPNSPVREHIDQVEEEREEEDHSLRKEQYQIPDDDADGGDGGDDA
ncbi:ABC transporter permease [Natronorubrum sp. DTA28]|uniref:ABC transporter permease n=1 Tax=Natronorubrum sp. DTA28 TaxID=3447019 RepID=UPI003F85BE39